MKAKILYISFFILSHTIYSQNLIGTRWLEVNAEKKDGSTIHDRDNNSYFEFHFKSINKVAINSISSDATYKIENSELTIGNLKYNIEKINATELVICEIGGINKTDDKKNRIYFIEKKKLIDYLIDNELLSFINDSTIIAKKYLKPILKNNRNLNEIITKSLSHSKFSASKNKLSRNFLTGNFRINTSGKIDKIEIIQNSNINKSVEKKFTKRLEKIDFIPVEIEKTYNQVVDFCAIFMQFKGVSSINILTNDKVNFNKKRLTIDEKEKSQQLFNDGVFQFTKKNYVEALKKFNGVIEIDSLFFDAYYNRAYTNLINKKLEESCKDWEYLKKMGQKEGNRLYNLKCK